MMFTTLELHRQKLVLIFGLAIAGLVANWLMGEPKNLSDIDWLDVIGEGGTAIALAVWMVLILGSRPAGRVTDLLTLGLGFLFLAMWQDSLDEFIRIPAEQVWDQWLESAAMPFGIGLLTYGLVHWHREQLAINRQLQKRERVFREHRLIDPLTQVGQAGYLQQQLVELLHGQETPSHNGQPVALIMADVDRFGDFNRRYGHREGDRLLVELLELLMLNLREEDLICRYAADRFAIVLPNTDLQKARQLAQELQRAVSAFAYKHKHSGESLYQCLSTGAASATDASAEQLIQAANQALEQGRMPASWTSESRI